MGLTVHKATSYMLVITCRCKTPSSKALYKCTWWLFFQVFTHWVHIPTCEGQHAGGLGPHASTLHSSNHKKNTGSVLNFVDNFIAMINISLLLKKKKKKRKITLCSGPKSKKSICFISLHRNIYFLIGKVRINLFKQLKNTFFWVKHIASLPAVLRATVPWLSFSD